MNATEPRTVTVEQIEAEIASEHYFTAAEGVVGAAIVLIKAPLPDSLHLLTFCVLVLRNGFTVTGQSACADPAKFNAEMGRKLALDDAIRQCWKLLGFRLRDQIAAETPAAPERKRYTAADIGTLERRVQQPFGYGYEINARMKDGRSVATTLSDFVVDHKNDLQSLAIARVLAVANGEAA